MKRKSIETMLIDLGIKLKSGYGRFKNRNIRYLPDYGVIQIGESDETFDRWANSVELEFDVIQPKGQRQFLRWINTSGYVNGYI